MRFNGGRMGRRRHGVAIAALLVAATCVVGATAAGQAGPSFKKAGGWGKSGKANGQFLANAYGLATSKSGDVYVADTDNFRVQVFSASGAFKRSFPFATSESVQDVAVGADGSAWATAGPRPLRLRPLPRPASSAKETSLRGTSRPRKGCGRSGPKALRRSASRRKAGAAAGGGADAARAPRGEDVRPSAKSRRRGRSSRKRPRPTT